MKKNLIIYIVAGAVVLAGLVTGGVIVGKKVLSKTNDETETTAYVYEDNGEVDYTVAEEPVSEELITDEDGNLLELVTDSEGNTLQAVVETDVNGEVVTKASGEVVTKKPASTTKKSTAVTTTKKASETKGSQKADSNATIVYNDDGTASIVKSDGSVALNYSYSEAGNYFYTDDNPWQRSLGFNRLYDMGAAFTCMYYDTVRIYYSYGNYDWLVQMWKGQYGLIFIGSEIGLYYKEKTKSTAHYDCATEAMEIPMQMTLYRDGKELFTRPYAPHWWITAFVPGKLKKFSDRSELTMVAKMTFKTEGERIAFCNALAKCKDIDGNQFKQVSSISKSNPETFKVNGNTVDFVWRYFDADRKTSTKTTTSKETTTKEVTTKDVTPTTEAPTTAAPTEAPTETPIFD
ncbi:MAG TPA: hypothetical protein DDY98_04255 [Ruminococcaceae bacterium]|nr:hypothetical protein [Oscillospiraceae bacterium]